MKKTEKIKLKDISKFKDIHHFTVKLNDVETDLQIGDKLVFPAENPILKSVVSMTIFEDGSVNYMLKWFDGEFKSEMVSATDLAILNISMIPRNKIEL